MTLYTDDEELRRETPRFFRPMEEIYLSLIPEQKKETPKTEKGLAEKTEIINIMTDGLKVL